MDKTVIVVGAGIKGLYVARELRDLGFKVTLLERQNTAGGKIKTIRSPTCSHGAFAEMGAMRILESNTTILQLLKELSIPIIPFIGDNDNAPFCINNQVGRIKDLNLGVLIDAGLVEYNVIEMANGLFRHMTFDQVLDLAFQDAEVFIHEKNNGEAMKICEFLSVPGEGEQVRECAKVILDLRFGKTGHKNDLLEFVQYRNNSSEKQYTIKDGYDTVIYSLIQELSKRNVQMVWKSEVISVDYSKKGYVKVVCKKPGRDRTETFLTHSVLFASTSLHKIEFTPDLPHNHQEIIIEKILQRCVPAMKSVLRFNDCFWQKPEHGEVIGGACIFGPSMINQIRLPPFYCKEEGYIMIYLSGEPVHDWFNLSVEDRINVALEAISKLFPSMKGGTRRYFKDMSEVVWNEPGSGAYILFEPEEMRDSMHPVDRLVFSPVPRGWVEDALKDGNIAVQQIKDIFKQSHKFHHLP